MRLTLPVLTALCCFSLTAAAREPDFQRLTDDWRRAYNTKDMEKLASFYADDAVYVSAHVPGLVARGREQIRENFRKGTASGGHIDTVLVLASSVSCEMASLFCLYAATNGGQKVSGRNVLVLKKVRGRWLIATHATVVRD